MTHDEDLLHKRLKRLLKSSEDGKVEFKNYKDMCEKLKLPVKTSNSKKAQLKKLKYFCNLEEGDKYSLIYTSVYTKEQCIESLHRLYPSREKYLPTKNIPNIPAIYGIYVDDKLYYIGSSLTTLNRVKEHCSEIHNPNQTVPKYCVLKQLIDDGGKLEFRIIDDTITAENRFKVEYQYIRTLCPILNGSGEGFQSIMYKTRKAAYIERYTKDIEQNNKTIKKLEEDNQALQEKIKILEVLEDDDRIDEIMQQLVS